MNLIKRADKGGRGGRRRRIAAVGMWDGVHAGHRFLIDHVRRQAARRGLVPAVVTFADHPLKVVDRKRAPALLMPPGRRVALLGEAGVEDCIMLRFTPRMRRLSARQFLTMLHDRYAVDTLIVGFNNRFGNRDDAESAQGFEAYARIGAEIGMTLLRAPEFTMRRRPVSSSLVRRLLAEGDLRRANRILGRPFSLTGEVVAGRQLGREIGFPTLRILV